MGSGRLTTVFQAAQTISAAGWVTFAFTAPFDYNGTANLMVDFSFNNRLHLNGTVVPLPQVSLARLLRH